MTHHDGAASPGASPSDLEISGILHEATRALLWAVPRGSQFAGAVTPGADTEAGTRGYRSRG